MKIYIKSNDGHNIKLWLPTSLLKSKFILNNIKKYGGTDIEPLMKSLPIIFKNLKKYIKEQGHFTLLEVSSGDNQVLIKI